MTASILGERVLVLRRRRGLTQDELGRQIGLSSNTIARLERGLIQDLRGQHITALAEVFSVSTDYLLGLSEEERPGEPEPAGLAVAAR